MKLVNVIQWVSCETANPTHLKSRPDRVIVKHTCAEVTERDRSCVERDIRLSIEPRDLYNCGSSSVEGRMNADRLQRREGSREVVNKGHATKHRRGLGTWHDIKGITTELGRATSLPAQRGGKGIHLKQTPGIHDGNIPAEWMSEQRGKRQESTYKRQVKEMEIGVMAVLGVNSTGVLRRENESVGK